MQKALKVEQSVPRLGLPGMLSRSIHSGVEELEWGVAHVADVSFVPAGSSGYMLSAVVIDAVAQVVSQDTGSTGAFRSW
jgi:hypothetical protein